MSIGPEHWAAVVRGRGGKRLLHLERGPFGKPDKVRHRTPWKIPVRTHLLADPIPKDAPIGNLIEVTFDCDSYVRSAVFGQVKSPERSPAGERGGQRREAGFAVGDEAGVGV